MYIMHKWMCSGDVVLKIKIKPQNLQSKQCRSASKMFTSAWGTKSTNGNYWKWYSE